MLAISDWLSTCKHSVSATIKNINMRKHTVDGRAVDIYNNGQKKPLSSLKSRSQDFGLRHSVQTENVNLVAVIEESQENTKVSSCMNIWAKLKNNPSYCLMGLIDSVRWDISAWTKMMDQEPKSLVKNMLASHKFQLGLGFNGEVWTFALSISKISTQSPGLTEFYVGLVHFCKPRTV